MSLTQGPKKKLAKSKMMPIKPKMIMHFIIVALLLFIVWTLMSRPSTFVLAPSDLTTVGTKVGPKSLFDFKSDLNCVPGPSARASYYTVGLTPGGLCGDGAWVQAQQRDYKIEKGIGGSLLEA